MPKDSTMLASLIVEVVAGIPDGQRKKPVAVLCTDSHYGIPVSRVGHLRPRRLNHRFKLGPGA